MTAISDPYGKLGMKRFIKVNDMDHLNVSAIRVYRVFYEQIEVKTREETLKNPPKQECVLTITDISGEVFTLRGEHAETAKQMLEKEALLW